MTSSECAGQLLETLPPVMRFVRKHMRMHRKSCLSVPQFRALALLCSGGSANLSAVADFLGASLSTTSRIVAGLVDKGLVNRRDASADRRNLVLVITPRGKSAMENAQRQTQAAIANELQSLGRAQQDEICRAMESLKSIFVASLQSDVSAADAKVKSRRPKALSVAGS